VIGGDGAGERAAARHRIGLELPIVRPPQGPLRLDAADRAELPAAVVAIVFLKGQRNPGDGPTISLGGMPR
jgi:hypothetical protein